MGKDELRHKRFCLLNMLVPMSAGLMFYVIFRPNSYISVFIHNFIVYVTRHEVFIHGAEFKLPQIVNSFAGDILWAYALTFAVCLTIGPATSQGRKAIVAISFITIIVIECLQNISALPGTFDPIDIGVELIIAAIAMLIDTRYQGFLANKKEM